MSICRKSNTIKGSGMKPITMIIPIIMEAFTNDGSISNICSFIG